MKIKRLLWVIVAFSFGLFAYFNWPHLASLSSGLLRDMGFTNPCEEPIKYSIGAFDERFDISQEEFLKEIANAEKIWEGVSGKDLFEYSPDGNLKINLIYDYRQMATDKLKSIGLVINTDKATYNSLKSRYDELKSSLETGKASLEADFASISVERDSYEKDVAYWNNRGGAPKDEYQKLDARRKAINNKISSLNARQERLKDTADTMNSLATVINQLITELNLNVDKYNSTTEETGEEFNEGEYIQDGSGMRIDIYQFGNDKKLMRVLAHELGHALGLEHVVDPDAIMYKLNQSDNMLPSEADVRELDRICISKK